VKGSNSEEELTITSNTSTSFTVSSNYSGTLTASETYYVIETEADYFCHTNVQGNVITITDVG